MKQILLILIVALTAPLAKGVEPTWPSKTYYRSCEVLDQKIFYREAGASNKTTIVLLHGYPSSSHTYRELIPLLSGRYHVIAPDYLGSGFSGKPDPKDFKYDFDKLTLYVDALLTELKVDSFVIYIQDFGAPVGFRLMMMRPDSIEAVIAQNANAYLEGVSPKRKQFFINAQVDKSDENVKKLFAITGADAVKNSQYLRDVKENPEVMSPDTWTHDSAFLSSDKEREIQVQLFQDYKTNLDNYSKWQEFLRLKQYPTLITWGAKDPVFIAQGAKAYLKDVPKAEVHLLDAGHFAVEEKPVEIAKFITSFLGSDGKSGTIKNQLKLSEK